MWIVPLFSVDAVKRTTVLSIFMLTATFEMKVCCISSISPLRIHLSVVFLFMQRGTVNQLVAVAKLMVMG